MTMPMFVFDRGRGFYFADRDKAEANVLMHYRVGGEKTGVRRWQNKDGSLTPEGHEHYAEMYGWGQKKENMTSDKDHNSDGNKKPQSRSERRQTEDFMKNAIQMTKIKVTDDNSRHLMLKTRDAFRNNKKFKELVNDDDIQNKKAEYRKIEKEWFEASGGEDFDGWDDKNGPENYGISKEQYEKAMSLDEKRRAADDDLYDITAKKVKEYVKAYADMPASKVKLSEEELDSVIKRVNLMADVELRRHEQR